MTQESFTQIAKSKGGFDRWSYNQIVEILDLIEGGGTGVQVPADWSATSGVTQVKNKPKINEKDLKSGNNTLDSLGIQPKLESGSNIKKLKVNDTVHDIVGEGTVEITTGGGEGGTGNYPDLTNKPQIEKSDGTKVEIVGAHNAAYYDLANKIHTHTTGDITNLDTKLNALDFAIDSLTEGKQPRLVDGENIATLTVNGAKHELTKEKDISIITGGGGGGTDDYNNLNNKPKINGVTVVGDKDGADFYLPKITVASIKPQGTYHSSGDLWLQETGDETQPYTIWMYTEQRDIDEGEVFRKWFEIEDALYLKQDRLISDGSNQNIKTINGESILGKGDIHITVPQGKVVIAKRAPTEDDLDDFLIGMLWLNIEHGDLGTIMYELRETYSRERYWEDSVSSALRGYETELPPANEVPQGTVAYVGKLTEESSVYQAAYDNNVLQWRRLNSYFKYDFLPDKPQLNGVTVVGSKTSADYGIQSSVVSDDEPPVNNYPVGTLWLNPYDFAGSHYYSIKILVNNSSTAEPHLEWIDFEKNIQYEKMRILKDVLDKKQSKLISEGTGQNIKTVNELSLLGSGNIEVQKPLESGVTIKTINGKSVLGEGDLTIEEYSKRAIISSTMVDPNYYDEGIILIISEEERDDWEYFVLEIVDNTKQWSPRSDRAELVSRIPELVIVPDGSITVLYVENIPTSDLPIFKADKSDTPKWVRLDGPDIKFADLPDKPKINNVELVGNKSLADIGINIASSLSDAHPSDLLHYNTIIELVRNHIEQMRNVLKDYVDNKTGDSVLLVKGEGFPDVYQSYGVGTSGNGKTPRTAVRTRLETYPKCPENGTIMWLDNTYSPENDAIDKNMTILLNPNSNRILQFKSSSTVMFKVAAHKKFIVKGANFVLSDGTTHFFNELVVDNTTGNVINITEDYIKEHAPKLRSLSERPINSYQEYIVLPEGVYEKIGEDVADDLATAKDSDLIPFGLVKEYVQSVINSMDSENTEFGG